MDIAFHASSLMTNGRVAAARQGTTAIAAVAIATLLGCADQVVGPGSESPLLAHGPEALTRPPASSAWQALGSDFIQRYRFVGPTAGRASALLGLAQYASVASPGRRHGDDWYEHDGQGGQGGGHGHRGKGPTDLVDRGAIAGASAAMLTYLFPLEAAAVEALVRQQELADAGAPSSHFARGEAKGREEARLLIERARDDNFDAVWTGTVPVGDSRAWVSSSAALVLPLLGTMTPFLMEGGDQFRPLPPPAASSARYLDDLAEVSAIAAARTEEQIRIANFWALSAGTISPAGYWSQRAAGLIDRTKMGERDAAHVFALVSVASMDALIGCWDAKYTYWFWRPKHADPALNMVLPLPNHPSYPSGHSCASAAAGEVLATLFPFEAALVGAEVAEAGRSRVYAGIHFQFDCDVGAELGRAVARYVLQIDRERGMLGALR